MALSSYVCFPGDLEEIETTPSKIGIELATGDSIMADRCV